MLRRSLLAFLGGVAASPIVPAAAEAPLSDPSASRWFIQVWFEGSFPIEADPADDPGRVEISIAGEFVACAWAPVYRSPRKEFFLVPLNVGATAVGKKEDIKVDVYGALKRLAHPVVKITAVSA